MIDYYDASEGFGNVLNWLALTQGGRGAAMPDGTASTPTYNALAGDFDITPYLVGGGLRDDAIARLDPAFQSNVFAMFAAAPEDIRNNLRITSAYRSPEVQARLYDEAITKYGSPDAARRYVAPPGKSHHNRGGAIDFKYLDPSAQDWVHANAAAYGLHFPMSWEPWHVELMGSRG